VVVALVVYGRTGELVPTTDGSVDRPRDLAVPHDLAVSRDLARVDAAMDDLSYSDLSCTDLSYADFSHADLSHATQPDLAHGRNCVEQEITDVRCG
jgi:hypothetical protein